MSYKLYAYWSRPQTNEIAAFEQYYNDVHVPKASAVPGLIGFVTTLVQEGLEGSAPSHYRVVEMEFASRDALIAASETSQWSEMRQCSGAIIERFKVSVEVDMGEVRHNPILNGGPR